jgi:arylsulfatase A
MTGNDASKYLRKQRQEAKEQAKAGGLKDKSTETDGFINVQ